VFAFAVAGAVGIASVTENSIHIKNAREEDDKILKRRKTS
jgi:hypothetical protein